MKDPGVQSLSRHDRSVWFDMICIMHESDERGVLLLAGKPMPEEALARILNLDNQELNQILTTLLTYGVASRREEDGAIYCRRMVRDEKLIQIRRNAGKMGGNPILLKQNRTSPVKQSPTPSSSSSSSSSDTTTTVEPTRKAERKPTPDDAAAAGKPAPNDWIKPIKAKINSMHPRWTKRPTWDGREDHSLFDNHNVWLAVTDDDWSLLKSYMEAWIPDEWRNNPRDMPQPDNRLGFLNLGPNSLLSFADRWQKLQLKQPA